MYSPPWTLVSMLSKSVSPILIPQHLQSSSMPSWSLWPWMIQRLKDTTTQQWHSTHLLSYTSALMRFKEKETRVSYSQDIYIPEGTSVSSSRFAKRSLEVLQTYCFLSVSFPQLICNRSSTIRQTQRKITNTAKLLPSKNSFLSS
jgi:hypothetical protein